MKIGLALSGGGVASAGHIGVLQAFEENNIHISCISGTSSGSIVAALYSIGYKPKEILNFFLKYENKTNGKKLAKKSMIDWDVYGGIIFLISGLFMRKYPYSGLLKGKKICEVLNELCSQRQCCKLKDAKIPLAIPSVDLITGNQIVFSNVKYNQQVITDASLSEAVRSSTAFPGIFKPNKFRDFMLVDGGVLNNTPVDLLPGLGSNFNIAAVISEFDNHQVKARNFIDVFERSMNILRERYEQTIEQNKVDYTINENIGKVGLLETNKISHCFNQGYKSALDIIKNLKLEILRGTKISA